MNFAMVIGDNSGDDEVGVVGAFGVRKGEMLLIEVKDGGECLSLRSAVLNHFLASGRVALVASVIA